MSNSGMMDRNRKGYDKEQYKQRVEGRIPGYARTVGSTRDKKFVHITIDNSTKVIARMQCTNPSCQAIREVEVLAKHVNGDDAKMEATILKDIADNADTYYQCGTCHVPLRMYEIPVEKNHNTEEI